MQIPNQYFANKKGQKTSAIVPFNEWGKFMANYQKLESKLKIFLIIVEGLREIKSSKKDKKSQPIAAFLNENNFQEPDDKKVLLGINLFINKQN